MLPETTSETKFALEGFLSLPAIAIVGVVLLALSWWMAQRDTRFADRPKLVWVLFTLRCVAVLILLWMLAGPTLVTVFRKFRMKSIAVFVDKSGSMGLVDTADGSGNVSRWAVARGHSSEARIVGELDDAVAMLRAAQNHLERLSKLS